MPARRMDRKSFLEMREKVLNQVVFAALAVFYGVGIPPVFAAVRQNRDEIEFR